MFPDAFILTNKDGKIQWVNDIAAEIFETSKMHLMTSNISDFIENSKLECQKIALKKFVDVKSINTHKNLIKFNEKICSEFLKEGIKHLNQALSVHDEIENFYKSAMNKSKTNKIADNLISAIL